MSRYVDLVREAGGEPPKRVVGQVASQVRDLLREGRSDVELEAGLRIIVSKALHPAALPSAVLEAKLRPERARTQAGDDELVNAYVAEHGWPTGVRFARGSHGGTYVPDPLGQDRADVALPFGRPTRSQLAEALRRRTLSAESGTTPPSDQGGPT